MINDIYNKKIPFKKINLYFGTRRESDLLYRKEFEKIANELPNFNYKPTLSQEDKLDFRKGHVHEHYLNDINIEDKPLVYFCGWDRMITEGRIKLDAMGFKMQKDIRVEIFG